MCHANVNATFMVDIVFRIKSGVAINVDASKKHYICEKDYIWNPCTYSCKNHIYLASITEDSVTTCDEITDTDKSYSNKF